MKNVTTVLISLFLAISCGTTPGPREVIPDDFYVPGPAPIAQPTDECTPACDLLRSLKCEAGNNLADGTTCEKFCEDTIENGIWLDPDCVMHLGKVTAPECPEVELCAIRENR